MMSLVEGVEPGVEVGRVGTECDCELGMSVA